MPGTEKEQIESSTPPQSAADDIASNVLTAEEEKEAKNKEGSGYIKKKKQSFDKYKNSKGDFSSKRYGGFLGVLRGRMNGVVKKTQKHENEIQQKDKFIQGDAAVNNYFLAGLKQIENSNKSELGKIEDLCDTMLFADQIYHGKFKKTILPEGIWGAFRQDIIFAAAKLSLNDARKSKKNVDETTGDRVIVEMYYNQISKIKEENKGKDLKEKIEEKKEAIDLFTFSKVRQHKVAKREEEQMEMYNSLESQGRVTTLLQRVSSATRNGIKSAALKIVTFGLAKTKNHQDKRGFVSKYDFNLDVDSGLATKEQLASSSVSIEGPISQINQIGAEFDAKRAARKGNGWFSFFSTTALVIDAFKKLCGIAKSFFSTTSLYFALLTSICPPLAVVSAILGTVAYYISLAMNGMSVLKLLFSSLAQILNDNPSLFLELQGETVQSGYNIVEEGASIGSSIGFNKLRADVTGQTARADLEGRYNMSKNLENNRSLAAGENAPELLSQKWVDDKALAVADIATSNVAPALINVGASVLTGSTDKLDATYNQSIDKNNRIGNNKGSATANSAESALIKKSYATTVEKAKDQSSKVSKLIFKTSKKEKVETNDSSLDSENQQKTKKVGSALKGFQSSGGKLISDLKWIENPMLSSK
jgi:hypothetical protein